jgi:hypothetical protein
MDRQSLFASLMVFAAVTMLFGATGVAAQTETVIHSFQHVSYGGTNPSGGVVADGSGALYGTTLYSDPNRANNFGTVYKLSPPSTTGGSWKETVLYSFPGGAEGENPSGLLFNDKTRKLYGTAENWAAGGAGFGLVYELSPGTPWTETAIYSFAGPDGKNPNKGLIADANGTLYGTTAQGGSPACGAGVGCGVVYKLTPPSAPGDLWTEQVLYSFAGADDGSTPAPGLVFDSTGNLYGATESGGSGAAGTVFMLTPPAGGSGPWAESTIHTFNGVTGSPEGAYPLAGLTIDNNGALYGTTNDYGQYGYGNVFQLTPPATKGGAWTENFLYQFTGGSDGGVPEASLVFDKAGALYGTTAAGGDVSGTGFCTFGGYGCGTAFKLTPPSTEGSPWTETVLHAFTNPEGYPRDSLVLFANKIYSTTPENYLGSKQKQYAPGTVFQITQ